jgi:CelD/BcsL family acetyltransferase involved in cellulose biosynthesis
MVDAAMSFRSQSANTATQPARPPITRPSSTVSILSPTDLSAYARLAGDSNHAPAQSALWIETWVASTAPDGFVAIVEAEGKQVCALAVEVVRSGPFLTARLMGGRHANGNFPACAADAAGSIDVEAILPAIHAARPDIDTLVLERLLPDLDGLPNPLLAMPHFPSPNLALAVNLEGGFDALLSRVSGKRKKKKHRSQMRKFTAAGGYRRIEAKTPEDVSRMLDAFFAMKEFRFRKMGVDNVFADVKVQNFFRSLFLAALRETPAPFELHALEVGGRLRAVTGSSRAGRRLVCEFGAIAKDELAHASPGDFLFFENIGEACREGFEVFDFSVGDEPYKRLWCDIETRHFDAVVPLTPKGRILAGGLRRKAAIKSYIKNSPAIWKLAKLLRRSAAGKQSKLDKD